MDSTALMHTLIPLAGMVTGVIAILLPALIVFIVLYYKHQRSEKLFETVRKLAEAGQPVPRELLDPPVESKPADSPLFRAITLLGVGFGLALMFYVMGFRWLMGVGGLMICIGAAQLLALAIERRWPDKT